MKTARYKALAPIVKVCIYVCMFVCMYVCMQGFIQEFWIEGELCMWAYLCEEKRFLRHIQ